MNFFITFLLILPIIVLFFWLFKDQYNFLYFLIFILPIQTIVLSKLAILNIIDEHVFQVLSVMKELALAVALINAILFKDKIKKLNKKFYLLILLNIFLIISSLILPNIIYGIDNNIKTTIYGLRASLLPILILYVGYKAEINSVKIKNAFKYIYFTTIIICLFGFIELLYVDRNYLIDGLVDYNILKGENPDAYINADLTYIVEYGGFLIKRMMSVYLSPLQLGYYLVVPISIGMVSKKNKLYLFLTMLSLILTGTRAVILGLTLSVILWFRKNFLLLISFILILALIIILTPLYKIIYSIISFEDPSFNAHLYAYTDVAQNLLNFPFGIGLGQAGPIGHFINGGGGLYSTENQSIGESLFLTIAMERGFQGLIFFILICLYIIKINISPYKSFISSEYNILSRSIVLATFIYLIASITTEVWISFQVGALYWWLAGHSIRAGYSAKV